MRQAIKRIEGISGLSAKQDDGPQPAVKPIARKSEQKRRGAAPDAVGNALRSAYDEALREDVPDDFLALLGQLS